MLRGRHLLLKKNLKPFAILDPSFDSIFFETRTYKSR